MHDRKVIIWNGKDGAINEHSPTSSRNSRMVPSLDGILDPIMKELKVIDEKLFRRNGDAKIIKREAPNLNTQDSGYG